MPSPQHSPCEASPAEQDSVQTAPLKTTRVPKPSFASATTASSNRIPVARRAPTVPVKKSNLKTQAGPAPSLKRGWPRATAPEKRKPLNAINEVDNWEAKYNQQLLITQELQSQKEKTQTDFANLVAEYDQKLASAKAQLVHARDECSKLQPQARLAGQLQTDLNVAQNLTIPRLQNENRLLKQELEELLEDSGDNESNNDDLDAANTEFKDASEVYIEELENTKELLESNLEQLKITVNQSEDKITQLSSRYEQVVRDLHDCKLENTDLKDTGDYLRGELNNAETQKMQLEDDLEELKTEMRDQEKLKNTFGTGCDRPPSTFSGILAKVSTEPDQRSPEKMPQPPLDRDLHITIKIEPTAAKFSLLGHLKTITTKGTSLHIDGPSAITRALVRGMQKTQSEAATNKAKIDELQQLLWNQINEVSRVKAKGCNLARHRKLSDDLAAMTARYEMQDVMLADYGRQLAMFRTSRGTG